MAAPTQWFNNSRNPRPRQQYFPQNEINQSFQRMPHHQQSFQQFNPRFPPPGCNQAGPAHSRNGPPNFPPPIENIAQNIHPYNQGSTNDMFHMQNNRGQPPTNCPEQINSSNLPPPYIATQFSQSFENIGRSNPLVNSETINIQHAYNEDWNQQINTEQNNMQPLNNANQAERHNFQFQGENISSQQEKWQKDSTLQTSEYNQAQDDQRWLQGWLQHRQQKKDPSKKDKPMKICEAQEKTRQMIVLLARLQKNKQILETFKHEDRAIWNQKLKEVLSLKNELEVVQKELTSEENIKHLRTKVSERKKKRERIKQRKKELYVQNEERMIARERKHAEIDKAMQQLIEKQKLEKQEKDMQKEADEILSQVRKKLTEANKSIQVINCMEKLRKLRTDRLERQGVLSMYESQGHSSTNKLMFEAKLSNMKDLLNKQLDIYKAEEAALKVHLETEQEETREKEREKTRLRRIERQKQERKKEENILFGSQKEPVPGDPIYPFRQYYDAANHSIDSLLAIRREWDSFLTSADIGSHIPDTWVIPEQPSSEQWGSALKT